MSGEERKRELLLATLHRLASGEKTIAAFGEETRDVLHAIGSVAEMKIVETVVDKGYEHHVRIAVTLDGQVLRLTVISRSSRPSNLPVKTIVDVRML